MHEKQNRRSHVRESGKVEVPAQGEYVLLGEGMDLWHYEGCYPSPEDAINDLARSVKDGSSPSFGRYAVAKVLHIGERRTLKRKGG